MFAQWDDHEVSNNWWPDEDLTGAKHRRLRYRETQRARADAAREPRVSRIPADPLVRGRARPRLPQDFLRPAARRVHARHAQLSRTERREPRGKLRPGVLSARAAADRLAQARTAELARDLEGDRRRSAARPDHLRGLRPQVGRRRRSAWIDGPPLGRELEIADLLAFIKRAGVRNTVWLTADVHYTAAHYYDPNKAVFQDFEPFWEFVSGPIHAGCFGPAELDNTFGPQLMYVKAPPPELGQGLSPATELPVLRPCRDRRRDRRDDGDAQGRRRPRAVVDADRAEKQLNIWHRFRSRSATTPQGSARVHGAGCCATAAGVDDGMAAVKPVEAGLYASSRYATTSNEIATVIEPKIASTRRPSSARSWPWYRRSWLRGR